MSTGNEKRMYMDHRDAFFGCGGKKLMLIGRTLTIDMYIQLFHSSINLLQCGCWNLRGKKSRWDNLIRVGFCLFVLLLMA